MIGARIIRSYLVDPFMFSERTFCCGCNDYVPYKELHWTETGERLPDYIERLQRRYLKKYGKRPRKRKV